MTSINISQQSESKDSWVFMVKVKEGSSKTEHTVTVSKDDKKRLAPKNSAEELVWASFLFLLDRESKESILSQFDLMLIAKYFTKYEVKIKDYL